MSNFNQTGAKARRILDESGRYVNDEERVEEQIQDAKDSNGMELERRNERTKYPINQMNSETRDKINKVDGIPDQTDRFSNPLSDQKNLLVKNTHTGWESTARPHDASKDIKNKKSGWEGTARPHNTPKPKQEEGFFSGKNWSDPATAVNNHLKTMMTHPETVGAVGGGIFGGSVAGPPGAIAGAGVGAYLGNAAKNAYNTFENPEKAPKNLSQYITDPLKAGAEGVIGEGIGQGIVKGYHGLKNLKENPIIEKVGKVLHGMPEKFTRRYLDERGKLTAREAPDIMNEMQTYHDNSAGKITAAEKEVQEAKEAVQGHADQWKDKRQSLNDQHAEQKYQTSIQHGDAGLKYSEAAQAQKESLQGVNVRNLVSPIQNAIQQLKDQVTAGSASAYSILGDQKGLVSIEPLKREIFRGMESMKLRGELLTGTDAQAYRELESFLANIEKLPNLVRFPEAKFILQRLDHDTTWTLNAGAFAKIVDQFKKQARTALDLSIKSNVPAYAKAMEKVSHDTHLLAKLSEKFGNPEQALGRLENLSSVKGTNIDFELLKRLDQETGANLLQPIVKYLKAQDTLKIPSRMRSLNESLPEHGKRMATQAELKRLGDPKVKKAIRDRLAQSNEAKLLNDSKANLLNKKMGVEQAEKEHTPFKPFSQQGVQARFKALNGARDFNAKKQFSALDEATGKNFSQEVTDRAILDAFERTDTAGSRKTVFGKAVGKFIGMLIGGGLGEGVAGHAGAAAGVAMGATMDKYSGQVFRKILDGRIGIAQGTQALEAQFGKYAPALAKAADRGVRSLATTVYMLSRDDEFTKRLNGHK